MIAFLIPLVILVPTVLALVACAAGAFDGLGRRPTLPRPHREEARGS